MIHNEYNQAVYQTCTMPQSGDFAVFRASINSEDEIGEIRRGDEVEYLGIHDDLMIKMIKVGGEIGNYDLGGIAELMEVCLEEEQDDPDPFEVIDDAIGKDEVIKEMKNRIEESLASCK